MTSQEKAASRGVRPGFAMDFDTRNSSSDGTSARRSQGPYAITRPPTDGEAGEVKRQASRSGNPLPEWAILTAVDMGALKVGVRVDVPAQRGRGNRRKLSVGQLRVSEIEKIVTARHGPAPVTGLDDLDIYARAVVHHLDDPDKLIGWVWHWVPDIDPAEVRAMIEEAKRAPLRWKADTIAKMLGVTIAERTRLGLRTIGATDRTRAQREADAEQRHRDRCRDRQEKERRKAGAVPRAEYEAQSVAEQCRQAGISRSTYLRRQRKGLDPLTGVDPLAQARNRSVSSSIEGTSTMTKCTCVTGIQVSPIGDTTFAAVIVELDELAAARQTARAASSKGNASSQAIRILTHQETRTHLLGRAADRFAGMANEFARERGRAA